MWKLFSSILAIYLKLESTGEIVKQHKSLSFPSELWMRELFFKPLHPMLYFRTRLVLGQKLFLYGRVMLVLKFLIKEFKGKKGKKTFLFTELWSAWTSVWIRCDTVSKNWVIAPPGHTRLTHMYGISCFHWKKPIPTKYRQYCF